jgi:myo-inositol-1(or 4)-monophosphatase
MEDKSPELKVAIEAALAAGKILEGYFATGIEYGTKAIDQSIITRADGECEEEIKKILTKNFPEYSIMGEETGHTKKSGAHTWFVDPLDGTRNFARGFPLFAVSIALELENNILLGVIYDPSLKALYVAEKGKGAYLNDKKISVSSSKEHFILSAGKGRNDKDREFCRKLMYYLPERVAGLTTRDFGSTCTDLSYFARGGIEAIVSLGLKSYDFAAGVLIAEEAGATITKLDGTPWQFPDNYFIGSNGIVHGKLVEEILKIQTT